MPTHKQARPVRAVPDIYENGALAFRHELAADILARTIWGEARGEGVKGMEAVAAVVMNRVAHARAQGGNYWWGNSIIQVCQMPYQFSCWNRRDPNQRKLLEIDDRDPEFATAKRIARRAMAKTMPDPTGGATHYHAAAIKPNWARGRDPDRRIGHHHFYKLV